MEEGSAWHLVASASLLPIIRMPPAQVLCMRTEVGPWLEQRIVVLQIEVMRLQVHQDKDRRDGGRELAKGVEGILRLQRDACTELLVVNLGTGPHPAALLPGSGRIGMKRPALAELAFTEMIHRRSHRRVVRRTMPFKDAWEPRRIGQRPTLVHIVPET